MSKHCLNIALALLIGHAAAHAADPNEAEKKLRESLRNTMLQLRSAETERAALQEAQTESDEKIKAQLAELEKLKKEKAEEIQKAAAEKDQADKAIADLQVKAADRDKEIVRLNESLAKWKVGYQKVVDLARTKEDERAKRASEVIVLQRRVVDQKMRNDEMYKIATEILTRYENYSLGSALLAKEPFTGITRVKLQTLVQDYQDKIAAQRIKVSEGKGTSDATAVENTTTKKSSKPQTASTDNKAKS